MRIAFEIHEAESYFVARWAGEVVLTEAYQEYVKFFDGPHWKPGFDELVDLSEADMTDVKKDELIHFAQLSGSLYSERGVTSTRTAVYAPNALPFGLIRLYQAWMDETPETLAVFKDREEALRWLRRRTAPGS